MHQIVVLPGDSPLTSPCITIPGVTEAIPGASLRQVFQLVDAFVNTVIHPWQTSNPPSIGRISASVVIVIVTDCAADAGALQLPELATTQKVRSVVNVDAVCV
jgi:hypothetical protein